MTFPFPLFVPKATAAGGPTSWTFTVSHTPYAAASPNAVSPTQSNMSDGVATTYYAPDTNAASWIRADFGSSLPVTTVYVADAAGTASWSNTYTNGRTIDGSNDASSWTTLATLSGHANDAAERSYSVTGSWRYVRVNSPSGWFAVSQLRFA